MKVGIILVNYKDYARRFLAPCLASIRGLDPAVKPDIFIVDNASTEESAKYLRSEVPEARLILNVGNDGFAKGNNDALRLMMAENYDYALLLNMDASLAPSALLELIKAAEADKAAAAVQARLMLDPDRGLINSLGNVTHFLGFGYCDAYRQKFLDRGEDIKKIAYPSGAAVLLRIDALRAVGLLEEEFWMYNEDQDLGWRFWLSGRHCLLAFKAVAYHQYEFSRSVGKYYWMERNRLIAAWKNYSVLSLVLFFVPLLMMELGMSFFALRSGWFKEKKKAWAYFFDSKHWPYLLRARKEAQALRRVPDYKILPLFSGHIWYQEIGNPVLKYLVNPLFSFYFFVARKIIAACRQ